MLALKTSATVLALGLAGSLALAGAAQACGHMKSVKAPTSMSVAQTPLPGSTSVHPNQTGMSIATSDVQTPLPVLTQPAPATR
jgi:hypothetical protein